MPPVRPRSSTDADVDVDVPVFEEDVLALAQRIQSTTTPKQSIRAAVHALSHYASTRGLSPDILDILLDAVTHAPQHLDQGTAGRVVRLLIPRRRVGADAVVAVVASLGPGPGKPKVGVQAALLRWLVMVWNVLEEYETLARVYGVLFGLLDMMTLRGHVCHLLSLLTLRKHVKPFRIQALLELQRKVGNEQPVNALIQVYKNYYPDVIVTSAGPFRAGVFSHPDPEWMQKVLTIQESNAASNPGHQEKSTFRVVRQVGGMSSKRRKTDRVVIPEVHTYRAIESSVTLEEVRNMDDFVKKFDRLELPSQLIAVLEDPLLQKFLALRPSTSSHDRINNWLAACLEDDLRLSGSPTPGVSARTGDLLTKIVKYTRISRELLPAVESYLHHALQRWDGKTHVTPLLALASFLSLREYGELYSGFLRPIECAMRSNGSAAAAAGLLGLYAELLRNWTVTFRKRDPAHESLDVEAQCLQRLLKHVGSLCLGLLQDSGDKPNIADAVLSFYECTSTLPWENSLFRVILPPDSLVYYFLFLGNSMMLSRLCGILIGYKSALQLSLGVYPTQLVDHFNGFIMDICNCIWRNRAFTPPNGGDNKSALVCTMPESVLAVLRSAANDRAPTDLAALFSLSNSATLVCFSADCFRGLQDATVPHARAHHVGPITGRLLAKLGSDGGVKMTYLQYRVAVLNYLKTKGFGGVSDFMYATMVSLMPKEPARTRSDRRRAVA